MRFNLKIIQSEIPIAWRDLSNGSNSKDRRLILDNESIAQLFDGYFLKVGVEVIVNSGWEFMLQVNHNQNELFSFALHTYGFSNRVQISPTSVNFSLMPLEKGQAVRALAQWFDKTVFSFLQQRGFRWFYVPHVVNEKSEAFWRDRVGQFQREGRKLKRLLD